jgi:hypothetical protein
MILAGPPVIAVQGKRPRPGDLAAVPDGSTTSPAILVSALTAAPGCPDIIM